MSEKHTTVEKIATKVAGYFPPIIGMPLYLVVAFLGVIYVLCFVPLRKISPDDWEQP